MKRTKEGDAEMLGHIPQGDALFERPAKELRGWVEVRARRIGAGEGDYRILAQPL
jgi:hypothetical protein